MASPKVDQTEKRASVEWGGESYEIVYHDLSMRQMREALSAATKAFGSGRGRSVDIDPVLYLEERVKRQVVSVGGEPFRDAMLLEWPDDFGLEVFAVLAPRGEEDGKNSEEPSADLVEA